jgi:hypothetical protein
MAISPAAAKPRRTTSSRVRTSCARRSFSVIASSSPFDHATRPGSRSLGNRARMVQLSRDRRAAPRTESSGPSRPWIRGVRTSGAHLFECRCHMPPCQ